ncbi:ABC transporter, partial [Candidatus Parcubacteria bacterium]
MEALRIIFKNRRLLFSAVLHDLRAKFSGNVFGLVWLILYPLLFLLMYSVVFAHILKVRMPGLGTTDYVLIIFCGLVPFLAFAESFGVGTLSLVSNRNLIRNTLFPVELVVAKDVLVGHASMGVGMALVWVACLYFGHVYLTQFFVLVVFVLQIVFSLGVMWITSTLT